MNSLKKFAAMLTALVLTATMLLCMSVGMSAAGYIGLKKVNEVSKGSTFSLELSLTDNPGISFIVIRIGYDSSLLSYRSVSQGSIFQSFGCAETDSYLELVMSSVSDSFSDGRLATVHFLALEELEGESLVTVSVYDARTANGGIVTVDGATVSLSDGSMGWSVVDSSELGVDEGDHEVVLDENASTGTPESLEDEASETTTRRPSTTVTTTQETTRSTTTEATTTTRATTTTAATTTSATTTTEATTAPPATTPELEATLPPSDTIVSENAIEESGLPGEESAASEEDSAAVLDSLDAENAQNQPQSDSQQGDSQQGDNQDGVDALADSAQASSPMVFILILAAAGVIVFVVISYMLRNRR